MEAPVQEGRSFFKTSSQRAFVTESDQKPQLAISGQSSHSSSMEMLENQRALPTIADACRIDPERSQAISLSFRNRLEVPWDHGFEFCKFRQTKSDTDFQRVENLPFSPAASFQLHC